MAGKFRHIGPPDLHDGRVETVTQTGSTVIVLVVGGSGTPYRLEFKGVVSAEMNSPEEMLLYALGESDTESPSLRRYSFVNWYADQPDSDQSRSRLELLAESFTETQQPQAKC